MWRHRYPRQKRRSPSVIDPPVRRRHVDRSPHPGATSNGGPEALRIAEKSDSADRYRYSVQLVRAERGTGRGCSRPSSSPRLLFPVTTSEPLSVLLSPTFHSHFRLAFVKPSIQISLLLSGTPLVDRNPGGF